MSDTRALRDRERRAFEVAFREICPAAVYRRNSAQRSISEASFIAGLRYRDEEIAAVLEEAEEFIESVTQWTGGDPDEREEMLHRLATRKASP